jgi:hypothetical protein
MFIPKPGQVKRNVTLPARNKKASQAAALRTQRVVEALRDLCERGLIVRVDNGYALSSPEHNK